MHPYVRILGATLAIGLASYAAPFASQASAAPAAPATPAAPAASTAPAAPTDRAKVQQVLDRLTGDDGAPGALAEVRDRHGATVLTSGVADLRTGAPIRDDSSFRIGSMTKPYIATVVLQLVGEHRVTLDAPVERYLPGVVRGNGNDGRNITVRQLLQHTSGLPDYLKYFNPLEVLTDPSAHHDPADALAVALAHPPLFDPGDGWSYSNTNYMLAAMLIEKVTGNPYGTEIQRRILTPLGLSATSVPVDSPTIPGPHPRGYVRPAPDAEPVDITEFNPSVAWGGGEMISNAPDMERFFDALLHGRLLQPAQLAEMTHVRDTGRSDHNAYGLGLERWTLPCGGFYWGHDGDILGFETMGGTTMDGRQVIVMANLDPGGSDAQDTDMRAAVTTALCS